MRNRNIWSKRIQVMLQKPARKQGRYTQVWCYAPANNARPFEPAKPKIFIDRTHVITG
jgi:hypothetical protein